MHLSRHFIEAQAHKVAWIPFSQPAPYDEDDQTVAHKPLMAGVWQEESEQYQLTLLDLQVQMEQHASAQQPEIAEHPCIEQVSVWSHPGKVTDLQVSAFGQGQLLLLTGSAHGYIVRLKMRVPTAPGAVPAADLQVVSEEDVDGSSLRPWLQPHQGPVASVCLSPDRYDVLTVGADGRLCIFPLDASQASVYSDRGPSVSYRCAAWSSATELVTAGTTGGLECWDRRQAGKQPARRSPVEWGHTGCRQLDSAQGPNRAIRSLCVHTARPHLCATGSSGGTVCLWDLRFDAAPVVWTTGDPNTGETWQVRFDTADQFDDTLELPSILSCTDDGSLAHTTAIDGPNSEEGLVLLERHSTSSKASAGGGRLPTLLHKEPCAINAFDLHHDDKQDIVAVTDQEGLVYLRRNMQV